MTRSPRSRPQAAAPRTLPSLAVRLGIRLGVLLALGLAACHPTDQPPIPPPKPTNPTNYAFGAPAAAFAQAQGEGESGHLVEGAFGGPTMTALPAEIIDASIVLDGSVGWDGARFELDAGASSPPERPGVLTTNGANPR
jgi:hypothetical protein